MCLRGDPPKGQTSFTAPVDGLGSALELVRLVKSLHPDICCGVAGYPEGHPESSGPLRDLDEPLQGLVRKTHETIRKVTRDIEERFHFNTAISAVMELFNAMTLLDGKNPGPAEAGVMRLALESLTLMLAPIVPHIAEELWAALGNTQSILLASWPSWSEDAIERDEVLVVVQVNGKLRSRITAAIDADEEAVKQMALADENVRKFVQGRAVRKVIMVKNKLVNVVV
jgi:leucyl-tRNA synthetase